MSRSLRPLATLVLALAVGCVQVYQSPPPAGPSPGAAAAGGADREKEEPEDPFEPWDEVLEEAEAVEGFFTLHRKRDGTVHLEVPPERLGAEFGLLMHYSRGVGDYNVQEGLPLSDVQLMRLGRVDDRIHLVHVNPRFTAGAGGGYEAGLAENVGHSTVAAFDIESRHEETGALLVDVTPFLTSDYPSVGTRLEPYYGGKPVNLDGDRSRVGRILAFPENVEIDAELTFRASSFPVFGGFGVSDHRSIPVGVRYSLFALPEEPMTPRYADDRVGYFLDAQWDFSRDREEVPYRRYVTRWRLEKADPAARISEPVEPIVYYVDPSVPEPYRKYVKQGIEAWNKAFEAAGFRNAVVAKDPPPGDSAWSAEDVRYSTVRWTPSYNMGYAIGPSQTDPRTGEILNADILLSANFLRGWLTEYQEIVAAGTPAGTPAGAPYGIGAGAGTPVWTPGTPAGGSAAEPGPPAGELGNLLRRFEAARALQGTLPAPLRDRMCFAEIGKAHQLAVGHALLAGLGEMDIGAPPEEYVGAAIVDLVMHEVGHTLGLRHNYRASAAVPHDRLNDEAYTAEHGLTLSVMDYGPVNVSPDRGAQGHYWNREVGSYDVWAIRYGYETIYEQPADGPLVTSGAPVSDPERERAGLRKIAGQSADPLHAYNTDGDAFLGSYSVDPLSNAWDLGDPLRYARDRARLVERVRPRLEERLVAEGEEYSRLRQGVTGLIFERYLALSPVTKMVGGLHFHRDHKGQPNARPPFVMVPAERQREAVRLLVDQAFDEDAWEFEAELLNRLPPSRYDHWGTGFITLPVDYPLHSQVLLIQRSLLRGLLAPPRLWRLIDNEARVPAGREPYRLPELFDDVTSAVWSELGTSGRARNVTSFRRNLQRIHLEHVGTLLLDEPGPGISSSVPEDARSLARQTLSDLADRIGEALDAGGLDGMTRAHLSESRARMERLLEVSLELERP